MNGFVIRKPDENSYDEIVLAQENLIVPAFVLSIDPADMLKLKIKLEKVMEISKGNDISDSDIERDPKQTF